MAESAERIAQRAEIRAGSAWRRAERAEDRKMIIVNDNCWRLIVTGLEGGIWFLGRK